MLSGGVEPEYVEVTFDIDVEVQLAEILNDVSSAAMSCRPAVAQYQQSLVQDGWSHFVLLIEDQYQRALRGYCPEEMLSHCVDLMTRLAQYDIYLDGVAIDDGFKLYFRIYTAEALSDFRQLYLSGQLRQLFQNVFSAFDDAVNISTQLEYQRVLVYCS